MPLRRLPSNPAGSGQQKKKWPARIDPRRAVGGRVQLIHETDLSAEDYVSTQAWRDAKLERCPNTPTGVAGLPVTAPTGRKTPTGLRVARYDCPDTPMTFSLLPQFMAAGMAGTLHAVEDSAAAVESEDGLAAAAERVRPGRHGDPRAARRWIRRRALWVETCLGIVIGLFPDLFAGTPIRIDGVPGACRKRERADHAAAALHRSPPGAAHAGRIPARLQAGVCRSTRIFRMFLFGEGDIVNALRPGFE